MTVPAEPGWVVVISGWPPAVIAAPDRDSAREMAATIDSAGPEAIAVQMASPDAAAGLLARAEATTRAGHVADQAALHRADAHARLLALVGDLTQDRTTPAPTEAGSDAYSPATGPWAGIVPLDAVVDPDVRHAFGLSCGEDGCPGCQYVPADVLTPRADR